MNINSIQIDDTYAEAFNMRGTRVIITAQNLKWAYHAANALFRRPDLFDATIAMSGFYDLAPDYFKGYTDDNSYFNNPMWYLDRLEGNALENLRRHCRIVIVSGQGAYEAPECSRRLSELLHRKGIPHTLDLWGQDVNHDWPWWRRMLPHYVDKLWP